MAEDKKQYLLTKARNAPAKLGVYRMLSSDHDILYVGKAKRLRDRVSSYFVGKPLNARTMALVNKIDNVEFTVTNSESEALILEDSYIKEYMPPYNVKLRDGKTYPWLKLKQSSFPYLQMYRGSIVKRDDHYGPFPNVKAVRTTLSLMRKTFKLRNCSESTFSGRKRPCLEYQIGNCSAPCVGLRSQEDYRRDCLQAVAILRGDQNSIFSEIRAEMQEAVDCQNYEEAAICRDKIAALSSIQQSLTIQSENPQDNLDIVLGTKVHATLAISVVQIREGAVTELHSEYLDVCNSVDDDVAPEQLMQAFVSQWYLRRPHWIPQRIITQPKCFDVQTTVHALNKVASVPVKIQSRMKAQYSKWQELAQTNLDQVLAAKNFGYSSLFSTRFQELLQVFQIDLESARIDCMDISHHQGEQTVGSCVAYGMDGPVRNLWRAYRLPNSTAGDDYLALEQTVKKKYQSAADLPAILIIDGGKGQVSRVHAALQELDLDSIPIVGIVKGANRKASNDRLLMHTSEGVADLSLDNRLRYVLQTMRDSAHRHGIRHNRARMRKERVKEPLAEISGIGKKLSLALLHRHGGYSGLLQASASDLTQTPGIGAATAHKIYHHLHPS